MNTIGNDIISLLFSSLDEVNANFEGLVIGNDGQNFSAGANLMLLMMEAVEGNWTKLIIWSERSNARPRQFGSTSNLS